MTTHAFSTLRDRLWRMMWLNVAGVSVAAWAFVAAYVVAVLGLLWDGGWHASWGRDTFFIPPHNLLYTGVTLSLVWVYAILVTGSLGPRDPAAIHIGRLQAAPGIWGIFLGCLMLIAAAPFDEWWHVTFGRDDGTGLWSPPHFAGMAGGLVVSLGILRLLRPARPNERPAGLRGLNANDLLMLLMFGFVTFVAGALAVNFWGIRHWYRTDPAMYPILTMSIGPAVIVLAQRVTGRAGAATAATALPFVWVGAVGAILRAADYPIVVSLPMMGLSSAIVLDLFYARFGSSYRWLAAAGALAALAFYPSEFLWASFLNGRWVWTLEAALRSLPFGVAAGTVSALAGAWLARHF